jgi:hypothetical protein
MWSLIKQNWSSARDPSSGIPTDVTFQVKDEEEFYEVTAHKYFLSLVSPVFKLVSLDLWEEAQIQFPSMHQLKQLKP